MVHLTHRQITNYLFFYDLTEMHIITVLQMIGCGDKTRTQMEVTHLFHEKFPNLPLLSQGTISKIEKQFCELGHVRKIKKQLPM